MKLYFWRRDFTCFYDIIIESVCNMFFFRKIYMYIEIGILTEIAYLDQKMLHFETYAIEHR